MPFSQTEQTPPSVPSNCGTRNIRNTANSPYALPSSRVDILRDDKGDTGLQKEKSIHSVLPDQRAGAGQGIPYYSEITAEKEKTTETE